MDEKIVTEYEAEVSEWEEDVFVIGISGKYKRGKDTLAFAMLEYIATMGNYHVPGFWRERGGDIIKVWRRAFADSLKEEVATFVLHEMWSERKEACHKMFQGLNYKDAFDLVIKQLNTDGEKEIYRKLMQWWGTEYRRKLTKDTYWLDALGTYISEFVYHSCDFPFPAVVMVPDVRFPNEAEWIKSKGGILVRVERSEIDEQEKLSGVDLHPSETALDGYDKWDFVFHNNGTLNELNLYAHGLADTLVRNRWK